MARKGIYDDWKAKQNVRKYSRYVRQIANQSQILDELRHRKNNIVNNYNKIDFDRGMDFFNEGILFEDIPEMYKKNQFFISGYNS